MGYVGHIFTWQQGKIRERLDRGLADASWNDLFPTAGLKNGEMTKSDHRLLIVDTVVQATNDDHEQRGFKRFESRWLKEETVEEMVKAAWARAVARGEGPTLMQKIMQVHDELHVWDRKVLKGLTNRIKKMKKELESLRRGPLTDDNVVAQKELLVGLELLLEQEELTWVQRARANWLKHEDRNTKFFQQYASSRKKKNSL
jgi:hypothetical protein